MGLGEIISEVLEESEGMVGFPWALVIANLFIIIRREKTKEHEVVGFWKKKNFLSIVLVTRYIVKEATKSGVPQNQEIKKIKNENRKQKLLKI